MAGRIRADGQPAAPCAPLATGACSLTLQAPLSCLCGRGKGMREEMLFKVSLMMSLISERLGESTVFLLSEWCDVGRRPFGALSHA